MQIESSNNVRAIADTESAIQMLMHEDLALSEANAHFRGLKLKNFIVPADGIICLNAALFFDTENQIQIVSDKRAEGSAFSQRFKG